jgi:pyrroloquinoline quinone (PQQ) biosynthesis protein C
MQKFIETTLENKKIWSKSLYFNFLQNCSKAEFLKSQIPFYYAVESFPRMLLKLALKIDNSDQRLLIIENIWEEHGKGDKEQFHTTTFKEHLNLLEEQNKEVYLSRNLFVEKWIDNILESNHSMGKLASTLAGIEYIYAVISEDIALYIEKLNFEEKSTHYSTHAELDWSHGRELLEVIEYCNLHIDEEAFSLAQILFIEMFDKLSFPTKKELIEVSKMAVSFYHSREDSSIGVEAIKNLKKDKINAFSICSGGEHILHYLEEFENNINIDLVDINQEQLNVFKNKLNNIPQEEIGKFEYLFNYLRQLTHGYIEEKTRFEIMSEKEELGFFVDMLFSRKNLNIIFTENATKYSSACFSEHFFQAFIHSLYEENSNAMNIFYKEPVFKTNKSLSHLSENITYTTESLINYTFDKKYDFIDLSNIGDWMIIEEYNFILKNAFNALNKGGILVTRKLLGDYSLNTQLSLLPFKEIISKKDKTCFYSSCYLGIK